MNIHSTYRLAFAVAVEALLLGWSVEASAASGYVKGKIHFWNQLGNYCPSSRDCIGARYLESGYDRRRPVREVQIQVVDASNLASVWGAGTTDDAGNYVISWSTATTSPVAKILWKTRHKDLVFEILAPAPGGIYYFTTGPIALTSGTTRASPQDLLSYTWGNSVSPSPIANLYEGAWRMWRFVLRGSPLMSADFTGVKIRAFGSSPSCSPGTGCADGPGKEIFLVAPSDAFRPQSAIMHEMGHMASYLSKPFRATIAYNYPCTGRPTCSFPWYYDTPEYWSMSFEEGLASFFADIALYQYNARVPATCVSTTSCRDYYIEESHGGFCQVANEEHRWPLSVERYLWDIYDTHDDDGMAEGLSMPEYRFFSALHGYPTGYGHQMNNEPWIDASYACCDNLNGRGPLDFYSNLFDVHGVNSGSQAFGNCIESNIPPESNCP